MTLEHGKQHQILNELYIHACGDLLSAYGLAVHAQRHGAGLSARHNPSYVSFLGASGEGISLSSMLKIDRKLVLGMHPLGSADISQPDLEDWCRELNNQLVGRVKNKLLGYGRVVNVGLPVLITGTNVTPVAAPNAEIHEYSFESADGQITLTLATLLAPDVELCEVESSTDSEPVLSEGALALF